MNIFNNIKLVDERQNLSILWSTQFSTLMLFNNPGSSILCIIHASLKSYLLGILERVQLRSPGENERASKKV